MAWDQVFHIPLLGRLIRAFGGFPVRLASADRKAVRESLQTLHAGHALMIFPEGGRSPDGRLLPFRVGFARVAHRAKAPVVAVTILGANAVWPPGRWFPRPGKVRIKYHAPLLLDDPDQLQEEIFRRIQGDLASRASH